MCSCIIDMKGDVMENDQFHCNNCGLDFPRTLDPEQDPDDVIECPRCHSSNVQQHQSMNADE